MSDIFDNYIKLCLLIRGPATQAFRALMTFYLQKCCLTFREFIDINQHEIYHLHTERRCCQCTGQSLSGDRTLLQMAQIEKMFDTSSQITSKRKDNHDYRKKDMCCCYAKCQICVDVLDITLLRILLNKFCNIFFWTCYLDIEHSSNFEQFLKNKRHELFHLWQPRITCCKCNEHKNTYKRPKISEINQHEFESLYTIDGTITAVECTLNDTCTYSARQGISLNNIKGTKLFKTITDCFCSPQKEINSIVETRNNFSHITDITEEEFKKCWSTLRDNIKKIETMTESKLWTEESIDKLEQKLDLKNLLQEIKTDLGKSIWNEKHSHEILEQMHEMKRELKNLFQKSRENNPAQSFTSLSHENYTEASICLHPKQLKLKLKKLYKENACGTEEAEKRLKENCRNLNLTLRNETPRDGNCFFDAVSSQLRDLGLRERSAEEIRENVIDYLMENKTFQGVDGDVNIEHFIDDSTFEDWASNMRRNGVFADHVVVLGMAKMLQTNMLIVTSNPQASPENCMTHIVGKMNYDGMTIILGHVWENHYYSLISLDATRENGRLVECCKMQSLNHRHSPLGICTTALKKMELDTPPSNYEVTSVDIYMTLKDRTITREMKIEGKGDVFAPDFQEIEIPCSSSISPMSYDNGDGESDCEDDLFRCGKCGKCFTTYESFSTHKKESIPCTQRKRKNIKKPTDKLGISSEQKQNMTPCKPNEKRIILKIRMQQTLGEMEPAWKQYVKQVQKTCTGNLDVGEEFIVEYIEEGSLVFWTKTNSSTIKNKAKFAEIMDKFMVNLFQKCPIDTEDETKFSFSVDVVEGAEDEDTDDEDENDVFICGRCGITFKSFSSFTSHKSNINLCLKKTRTNQQHKNKKSDVEKCLPCAPTPVVEEVGQASGKEDTGDTPTEFVIEVSGMKPTTSEDTLRFFFEGRRGANADVVKMEFIEEKEMYMVWFEDESAIEAVMSKNLRVDGKTLKGKRYVPPTPQKPVQKYDDKVFITNISLTTTKDGLENFLEVKSGCIPKESIFGEAEGTALVTFDQPPDIEKLQTACMKRPLEGSHLSIHTVPITDCVVVTGFKDTTLSVTMEYYFDNKKRSGVEGVREVKLNEDERKCLVYFTDPDSALKVCNKKHTVEGQLLKVQVYYECLGQTALDDDGPKFKSLKPIVIFLNPQKIEFLLNSFSNKMAFEKQLSRHYADVEWPDIKGIKDTLKVNCTLTEEVKDCRKLTQTWAKTVTTETEKFFSMFTVNEIQILQGAWDDVLKHLREISISYPESVAVKVVKGDCKIVIVGHKISVYEVEEKYIMKYVAKHDRKTLQVTEEVSLKHFQLLVLLHLHFLDNMKKEFEGLRIQVDRKKHKVIFTGRSSHVNAAKVKTFEQIQELTGATVGKFSVGYIEFLKIPEVKIYVSQQIKQKRVLGVWNIDEDNIITIYSLSDEGAVTACDVLKKSIIETRIPLDDKQSALIGTDIWNKEIKAVEIECQKALVKIVLADSKTIVIYQTSAEDKEILKEKVTDIFYRHATSKEKIQVQLSSSGIRLLQEQYQIELNTLKEQSAKDHVTLILDNISIYIQGNSKRVKDAKQKMDDILRSIYRKKYTMKKAGIVKHMRSEQGQAKISQVEKKNNVIIQLQTGNDNDDEEQENRSHFQPISPRKTYTETAMCTIPSGQTIITVVGDITELDVDVIVNSANKELQHVGGLAKVIVDKGGKSIQKECDAYVGSKNKSRMYEGEIFCSSPGYLNCKMIVHAVGPVWQDGQSSEDECLSECIQASLEKIDNKRYKSIAIPALCTGILGYPPNKATKVIVEAIRDYMRENGASSPIRQIYLCDVKEDIVDHFVSALERYFDKSNIKKQRGKSGHVSSSPVRFRHVSDYYGSCLSPKRPSHLENHITVTLVKGQIASQKVDVIVNTTSTSLQLNQGAVSQSLLKMGGTGIQAECSQQYPTGIQPGEMAETTGGKLECKMIYHGALPGYNGTTAMKIMETFMNNCLEIANDNGFVSVAFPALGTGNLGYPKNEVAKIMFSCVDRFSSSHPTSSVCDVRFVVYDEDYPTIKAFEEEQRKRQSGEYVSTQTKTFGLDSTTYQEEKKDVSTKQWTASKMPSSVLNLVVYAKKENDADSALRSLEESLINDYKEKNIEDALIKELSKEQEAAILKLEETCEVEIEFNKKIGCINVRGLIENLSKAIAEVYKIIRDLDRQKQKQLYAKYVADVMQWYFISVEGSTGQKLEEYPPEVNLILERALKNNEPQAFFLDISGNKYIVDFTTYEEYPEDDPTDTVAVLRKSKFTDSGFDMPSNWASMDQYENIKIVTLQPADKEYQDIVQDFQTNMAGNYEVIVKIEKIQNITLLQQYEAKKKFMDSTNTTVTNNERKLWHGTAMEAVGSINTFGFNRAYCEKNAVAYGNGVYFAVNPTYSAQAQYARPDPNGNKRMYMCKVLVGEFTKGQGGMKVPPPKPGAAGGHILYDSVVDNPECPSIFVIFHDTQAYPEYLIVFR